MSRVLLAMGITALITIALGPVVIPLLRKLKFGQNVRDDGPKQHLQKAGTPTMGGLMFLISILVVNIMFWDGSLKPLVLMGMTAIFGLIGFADDYIKIVKRRSLGLRAKEKIFGQTVAAVLLAYVATYPLGLGTAIAVPFTTIQFDLGFIFYVIFTFFVVVGTSNAVNLTDGLDGLAAGITVITSGTFAVISMLKAEPGTALFAGTIAGGCLGFLWYNSYPARVFMGDTGSLALGGALGSLAVLTKTELLLPLIGGVYVAEVCSVMIQVAFFKRTGKRIFRMSPLHHHFELGGWSEKKVVFVFWSATLVCSVLGLMAVYRMG